jgi:hypothetical protein
MTRSLSAAALQRALDRLPARRRWLLGETPLDWRFSTKGGFRPLDETAFDFPLKPAWRELLVFGEYDYAEGGGAHPFLGIRGSDGAVFGLDFERDKKPLFLLNSGLSAFVDTFEVLDEHLRKGRALPEDVEKRLRDADQPAYARSDWKPFVAFARGA